MQPQSHQTLLLIELSIVHSHQRDAIYQLKPIKSTGKLEEPPIPSHLRKVFVNNVSKILNLNPQNIMKDELDILYID